MSMVDADLLVAALDLPTRERARLAHQLIVSLEVELPEDQVAVERDWDEEISRRVREVESGDVAGVPASEVFADIRTGLAVRKGP